MKILATSGKRLTVGSVIALCALLISPWAHGETHPIGLPDLTGTHHCEGDVVACEQTGTVFNVVQSGSDLEIKSDKGLIGSAKLTSEISVNAATDWNMFGVIGSPDNLSIQWSNGTTWRKE